MELLDVGLELVGGAHEAAACLVAQESVLNRYMYGVDPTTIKYESYPTLLRIITMLHLFGRAKSWKSLYGASELSFFHFYFFKFFFSQCPETGAGWVLSR